MFLYTGMILLKSYELGLFDLLSGAHQLPIFGLEYESSNALDVGKRLEFFGLFSCIFNRAAFKF